MKNFKFFFILSIFSFFIIINSFSQNNTIDGVWYNMNNYDKITIRIFKGNQTSSFEYSLSDTYVIGGVKSMPNSLKNFTFDGQNRIKIDGTTYTYYTSPAILIIWEPSVMGIVPKIYYPVLEINFESLIGNWIIPGNEYDIELEITNKTFTLKRGRVQKVFTYSSGGFPIINLKDSSGKNFIRNYFFLGKDIAIINIPGENETLIFQRKR